MRRTIAILLAAALGCGLLATAVLAQEGEETIEEPASMEEPAAMEETAVMSDAEAPQSAETAEEAVTGAEFASEADDPVAPDAAGTLSFANLADRVRENNLSVLALQETVASIEVTDYTKLKNDLQDQLSGLEDMRDGMNQLMQGLGTVSMDSGSPQLVLDANDYLTQMLAGYVISTLESSMDSLGDAISDIKNGKTQKKAEDGVLQLQNAQDKYVVGAESLYITVLELQNTKAALERSLEAMDRTVEEMELRYDLGQVSALQLRQVKSGRTQLQSGLDTLKNSMEGAVIQLEIMVGADITGQLTVSEVPEVTDAEVDGIHYAADLALLREKSYDLHAAQVTLDDAEETYKDAKRQYGQSTYQRKAAEHTWQAAQYTYQATVQSIEVKFRSVCSAVGDYRQVLRAKEEALELQEATFQSVALKYQQGTVSKNDYLSARDDLASARNEVTTAKHDLFTAYRAYDWAVRYGVLN
jgi:hypothetical protein